MFTDQELHNSTILVVDDNIINVELLVGILENEGYRNVLSTTDPRDVQSFYINHQIDLILLDMRMPHMDGVEVMEQLKALVTNDYIPVLIITAQTDNETKRRALAAGARDFITKPYENWEVLNRVHNMLETRYYYNHQVVRGDMLEKAVKKRVQEVRDTQLEIVRRLGRAGEYRDNETGAHVIRMSKICELLTKTAGLNEEMQDLILYASPMHDVGKIGIPDSILLKPGKLDEQEWEIMKTHTIIGEEILKDHPSDIMQMAASIAISHHEKWDGSGYPKALKGEAIPLEGRIATLSDVFDALLSARPYKKAWSVDDTLELIRGQSGKHFDPNLVEHFLKIIPDVLKIRDQFKDEDM